MKTIMSRISRSKNADSETSADDRSNAAKAYKEVAGIDLYDSNGQYKNLDETLTELAAKWDTLTDAQRNYIAEQSAGVRNINIFTTMMDNYAKSMDLANAAIEDTGFADSVQEKFIESLTGKINTLKSSVEEFWNTLISSDAIGMIVDAANILVNLATKLLKIFEGIGDTVNDTVGTITTFIGLFTTFTVVSKSIGNFKDGGSIFSSIFDATTDTGKGIKKFFTDIKDAFTVGTELTKEKESIEGVVDAVAVGKGPIEKLSSSFGALTVKTGMSATKLLGWGAAIIGTVVVVEKLWKTTKETAEEVKNFNEEAEKLQKKLKDTKSSIDSLAPKYEELSEGVGRLGENQSLTTEEYKEFQDISNEIAEMFPQFIAGYDDSGNAIIELKNGVEDLNTAFDEMSMETFNEQLEGAEARLQHFKNTVGDKQWWNEIWDALKGAFAGSEMGLTIDYDDAYELLDKIDNMSFAQFKDFFKAKNVTQTEANFLYDVIGVTPDMTEEMWHDLRSEIVKYKTEAKEYLDEASTGFKNDIQASLKLFALDADAYPEYADMSDSILTKLSSLIAKMTHEQLQALTEAGLEAKDIANDYLQAFSGDKKALASLDNLLSIDESTSIEELRRFVDEDLKYLADILGTEDEYTLALKFNIGNADELIANYDNLLEDMSLKIESQGVNMFKTLMDNQTNAIQHSAEFFRDRMVKTLKELEDAGWTNEETLSKLGLEGATGDDAYLAQTITRGEKTIVASPILPDGSILSPEAFSEYIDKLFKGESVDVDITLGEFDGQTSVLQAREFAKLLKEASKYYDLGEDRLKEFLKENKINTQEQIDLLESILKKADTWEDVVKAYDLDIGTLEAWDAQFDRLKKNLEQVKKSIEAVQDGWKESYTSKGMGYEVIEDIEKAFSDIPGFDYDSLFESTSLGVQLNVREMEKLQATYESMQKDMYSEQIAKAEEQYKKLTLAIYEETDAMKRSDLVAQRDAWAQRIQDAYELNSVYEGLTNSVTKYLNAKEVGEYNDTYLEVAGDLEKIKDQMAQGWWATGDMRAWAQMWWDESLAGVDDNKIKEIVKGSIDKANRWLKEKGTAGLNNFLEDASAVASDIVYKGDNGNWIINNFDNEELADRLNVSVGLIDMMFAALKSATSEITFAEPKEHLIEFRKAAEENLDLVNKSFEGLTDPLGNKTDFKFDLTVEGEDAIKEQIYWAEQLEDSLIEAYGTGSAEYKAFAAAMDYLKRKAGELAEGINVKINYEDNSEQLDAIIEKIRSIEGYTDFKINWNSDDVDYYDNQVEKLKTLLSEIQANPDVNIGVNKEEVENAIIALTNQKNLLDQPVFMKLDSSNFTQGQKESLEMLQELQTKIDEINTMKANPEIYTTTDIEQAEKNLKDTLTAIQEDPNYSKIAVAFGIDTSGTAEELDAALGAIDKEKLNLSFNLSDSDKQLIGLIEEGDQTIVTKVEIVGGENAVETADSLNSIKEEYHTEIDVDYSEAIAGKEIIESIPETKNTTLTTNVEQVIGAKATIDTIPDEINVAVNTHVARTSYDEFKTEILTNPVTQAVVTDVETKEFDDLKADVKTKKTQDIYVEVDREEYDELMKKAAKLDYKDISTRLDTWDYDKKISDLLATETKTIRIVYQDTGMPAAHGSAKIEGTINGGTALAEGNALVGELGSELRVRNGKFELLGAGSAELANIKPGDIIFNAEQTKQLLETGQITMGPTRGKAYADGKGFIEGIYENTNTARGSSGGTNSSEAVEQEIVAVMDTDEYDDFMWEVVQPDYKTIIPIVDRTEYDLAMADILADETKTIHIDVEGGGGAGGGGGRGGIGGSITEPTWNGSGVQLPPGWSPDIYNDWIAQGNRPSGVPDDWYDSRSRKAFAGGSNGAPRTEPALVGELGPELRVNPRTGEWDLLGAEGAEFAQVNKGDIIFNHQQSKELLENGSILSRGKAFVNGTIDKLNKPFKISGTAYARGSWNTDDDGFDLDGTDYVGKKKKEFKEMWDWIEIAVDRIERAIARLDNTANNVYKNFTKRNNALKQEYTEVTKEIDLLNKAADRYLQEANSVDLSSEYKKLIREGAIDIETITDEALNEKMKKYQELYNKHLDALDNIQELEIQLGDIITQVFDNIATEYELQLDYIDQILERIDISLDLIEAKGQFANTSFIEGQMELELQRQKKLKDELAALEASFADAMATGKIDQNSEAFMEMQSKIQDVSNQILESEKNMQEFNNALKSLDWEKFEYGLQLMDRLRGESDFLIELLGFNESELFNKKNGTLSEKGQSIQGLHLVNYNNLMHQADEYGKKIEEINADIAKDPNNKMLLEQKEEYIKLQQDAILNASKEKQAVIDLIESSYKKMLEILQELIDKRKQALEAEKDLWEYEQSIKNQVEDINDIKKQLTSLEGDTSEEAMSKRQQLEDQLKDAEDALEASEYDRWYQDQQFMLDQLMSTTEEWLNARLDDIDGLIKESIDATNENSGMIKDTIESATGEVGYEITEDMKNIWSSAEKVVTDYSDKFSSTMTTTNGYIQDCKKLLESLVSEVKWSNDKNSGSGSSGGGGWNSGSWNGSSSGGSGSGGSKKPSKKEDLPTWFDGPTPGGTQGGVSLPEGWNPGKFEDWLAAGNKPQNAPDDWYYDKNTGDWGWGGDGRTPKKKTSSYSLNTRLMSVAEEDNGRQHDFWVDDPVAKSNYKFDENANIKNVLADEGISSSFGHMRDYYESMGLGDRDDYTGTYSQNKAMLSWIEANGFKNSGRLSSLVHGAQEEGLFFGRADDHILSKQDWDVASLMADKLINFATLKPNLNNIPQSMNMDVNNDINLEITLPNVHDYQSFKREMQNDPQFEKMIQAMTIDKALGKNSLNKYKFK